MVGSFFIDTGKRVEELCKVNSVIDNMRREKHFMMVG